MEHSIEEGFKAETYFTQHPDIGISQLATRLAVDDYQLGKGFEMKHTEQGLRQHIEHLLLDFRYIIVQQRLKEINRELKEHPDETRMKELVSDYMEANKIFQQLGKELGR